MPIRLRLTLMMAVGTAVLVGIGSAVFLQGLQAGAQGTLERVLVHRARRVSADLGAGRLALVVRSPAVPQADQSLVQVIGLGGRLEYTTELAGRVPVLSPARLARARHTRIWFEVRRPGWGSPRLVLAEPNPAEARAAVIVVGTSLDQLEDTIGRARLALLTAGPLIVVLAAGAVWLLTRGALAPVERLRAQAAEISAHDLGRRVRVPATHDEVAALARTLNELLDRLTAAAQRQRQFVAAASHELRHPLAALRTELELARRPGRPTAERDPALERALARVDALSRLTRDLLVLARGDEGRMRLHAEPRALGPIAGGQLAGASERADAAGVALVLDAQPGVTAVVDETWLRQAIDNLLDNALRHAPRGTSIELLVRSGGGEAVIEVCDRGPGFPPDLLPRAFERFQRGESAAGRREVGTGLGLSIVRTILEAHLGRAEAANRPGGGAVVRLCLPRAVRAAAGDRGPLTPPDPSRLQPPPADRSMAPAPPRAAGPG